MQISSIEAYSIEIPFRGSFTHASKSRATTESVLVRIQSKSGGVGLGESCPRSYVTGENVDSCIDFIQKISSQLRGISSIDDLRSWVASQEDLIVRAPAAWCALEIAILDLMAREEGVSVEALLDVETTKTQFNYTAVVGVMSCEAFRKLVDQYRALKLNQWKVKLSGTFEVDLINLSYLHSFYPREQIRLDANNIWASEDEARNYLERLPRCYWALEEPLKAGMIAEMFELSGLLNTKTILDESFSSIRDIRSYLAEPDWLPNIRVSKCGGIIRSLSILKELQEVPFILGCQVGETSLLTRAALVVARAGRHTLVSQEGAFGTLLLQQEIVEPVLNFSTNGILSIEQTPSGLGLALQGGAERFLKRRA